MEVIDISRDSRGEMMVRKRREQIRRAKRKAARRRAIQKLVRATLIIIVVLTLIIIAIHFGKKNGIAEVFESQEVDNVEERIFTTQEMDIVKPVAISTSEELQSRLEQFVTEHPECTSFIEQQDLYTEDLLKAVCNNEEMIDFVLDYPNASTDEQVQLTTEEEKQKWPLFIQWDERWGYHRYGESVIGLSGCGPTCVSMVVTGLTGRDDVTPDVVADFAMVNGYYVYGTGTMWSLMSEGCEEFGVYSSEISNDEQSILESLEAGYPIICSVGPGHFTTAGHFIVLVGTQDGKIIVNDPNSRAKSEVLWSYDTLQEQIKSLWAYEAR